MGLTALRLISDFTRNHATKTMEQPSRLVFGPLFRLVRMLVRFPRIMPFVLPLLPGGLIERTGRKAFYFEIGYKLFQHDRPAEAWPWFDQYLSTGRPSTDDFLVGAMCLYHGLGRFRDALSLLKRSNDLGIAEAEKLGLANIPYRVIDNLWARHIGHTATIDYVVKLGILEGRRREDTIFYLPSGSPVANRFLLEQMAPQVRLVERAADLPFEASAVQALHFDYLAPRLPDRSTVYFWEIAAKTYERWREQGKGPLLVLPSEVKDRGWNLLREAGIPHNAWFVALHVREGKWDGRNPGLHGVLNSDMDTYLPAIAEITRRGGWVIRMGDPGMTRLAPIANVIDYCHSGFRSDWMDVFLATQCRFMLGSASGPVFIPPVYGVPALLTNWWPPAQRPLHESELFMPKLMRRSADGRYLTLSETLQEPFSYCHSRTFLTEHEGVYVEDNDPEVIRAAVEEMFSRLDGNLEDSAEIAELRSRADQIYRSHACPGMVRLSAGFLSRYRDLIA